MDPNPVLRWKNQNDLGTDGKSNHKKVEENMDCDGTTLNIFIGKWLRNNEGRTKTKKAKDFWSSVSVMDNSMTQENETNYLKLCWMNWNTNIQKEWFILVILCQWVK